MNETEKENQRMYDALVELAKSHRKMCTKELRPDCFIELHYLGEAAQNCLGRKLTVQEWEPFV